MRSGDMRSGDMRFVDDRAAAELITQVMRAASSLAFSGGLNPAQWSAMRYFAQAAPEARSVVAFARYHRTTKGTASQTIAALLKKGLLDRRRNDRDRRSADLEVTAQGVGLLQNDPLNELAQAVGLLNETERRAMTRGLERILTTLEARRDTKSAAASPMEPILDDAAD